MADNYVLFSTLLPFSDEACDLALAMHRFLANFDIDCETNPCQVEKLSGEGLWLYSEDNGGVEYAVTLASEVMRLTKDDNVYTIEWATTCSKPRVGEFGGGCVAFDRFREEWFTSGTQLGVARNKILEQRKLKEY